MAPKFGHVFKTIDQRLSEKTQPEPNSGCWIWLGADNACGYGAMTMGRSKRAYAHRVSYEFHCGPIQDGMHLDHLCRNTFCVNPRHLEPVTNAANIARGKAGHHMKNGTAKRGSEHHYSKLTEEAVLAIRASLNRGETHHNVAASFGISQATVGQIARRVTWRHV